MKLNKFLSLMNGIEEVMENDDVDIVVVGKDGCGGRIGKSDLKFNHIHNTYINKGLPPSPISYVSTKTIDIILENYKTDYLFYFFNSLQNKHVFSKNYNNHLKKLSEYRKSK